jgi:hypothetical protein
MCNRKKQTLKMAPTFLVTSAIILSGALKVSGYHPMLLHFVEMGLYNYLTLFWRTGNHFCTSLSFSSNLQGRAAFAYCLFWWRHGCGNSIWHDSSTCHTISPLYGLLLLFVSPPCLYKEKIILHSS